MRKIIFFIGCFFTMINTSMALSISCPKVVSPGEIFKIHVEEKQINGLKVKYNFDSGFAFHDVSFNSSWKDYYTGIDGFSVGNVTNQDPISIDIDVKVNMDVQIDKDYNLELVEIAGSDYNYKSINIDNVFCKVRVLSDIKTLDSLIVDNVKLSPNFDKNITSYKATTKNEKVVIKAIASDSNSKIEGDIGEQKLNIGVNTFVVKVISARGNVKEYNIYITRISEKKNNDVTLKRLSLSEGYIDFKSNIFLYSTNVDYVVNKIDVEAIPNSSKARIDIQKPDELVVGDNTINIVVTAEDGTSATYVIIVNRKAKLSSDATIKTLKIKNYEIDFDSNKYDYSLKINGEDKLDIEVILNDINAKYIIYGNNNLKNNSIIEIKVIAEDSSTKVYSINISKLVVSNSNALNNYIKLFSIIGFIILIIMVLLIKILKNKFVKNS